MGGKAQEGFGRASGDVRTQAKGVINQAAGTAQDLYGQAKESATPSDHWIAPLDRWIRKALASVPQVSGRISGHARTSRRTVGRGLGSIISRTPTRVPAACLRRVARGLWRYKYDCGVAGTKCRREIPCLPPSNNCRAASLSATLRFRLGCPMRRKSYRYLSGRSGSIGPRIVGSRDRAPREDCSP
jgi:uncharacterized protein YjbJ (UPF0337 family)